MIRLTRLDGNALWVNAELIVTVEATPDTVLLLSGGQHLMVKEKPEEVVERTVAYKRRIHAGPVRLAPSEPDEGAVVPFPRPAPAPAGE